MADQVYNISLGSVIGKYDRVDLNDPAASVLTVLILQTTGLESDATLKDFDAFSDIIAGATNEATNTGYVRIELSDTDLTASVPTDASDQYDIDIPDQTWTSVQAAGGAWSRLVICYDDDGLSTDTNLVPMTQHDFVVTPDGSDITAQIDANGFFRAS